MGVGNGVLNGVEGGGRKGDGVVGGVRGGCQRGTHHLINVGNSHHIFVASPDNESFLKILVTASHVDILPSRQ